MTDFYIMPAVPSVSGSRFVYELDGVDDTGITIPVVTMPVDSEMFFDFFQTIGNPPVSYTLFHSSTAAPNVMNFIIVVGNLYQMTGCQVFVDGVEVLFNDPAPADGLRHSVRVIATVISDVEHIGEDDNGEFTYIEEIFNVDIRPDGGNRRFYAINDVNATVKDTQDAQDGTVNNHDITQWVKLAR